MLQGKRRARHTPDMPHRRCCMTCGVSFRLHVENTGRVFCGDGCRQEWWDQVWSDALAAAGVPWYPDPLRYDKIGRRLEG